MCGTASQHPAWGTGRALKTVSRQPAPWGRVGREVGRQAADEWPRREKAATRVQEQGPQTHSVIGLV